MDFAISVGDPAPEMRLTKSHAAPLRESPSSTQRMISRSILFGQRHLAILPYERSRSPIDYESFEINLRGCNISKFDTHGFHILT